MLPTAQLGKDGPQVTRLGYGMMGLSAFYGKPKPDEARFAVLDKVFAEGVTLWDSADAYLDSEELIARWLTKNPGKRDNIFLSTKFGFRFGGGPGGNEMYIDSSPKYARQACERSLARLGVSHIDIYYVHRFDKKTPVESTMVELQRLKREGLIRHIGLSECSAATLRRACVVEHVDAIQVEYSPFTLDIERIGLLQTARELGVAIVAYSPVGRGLLSGQIRSNADLEDGDSRKASPRFTDENFPKNLELVDIITRIADKKSVTSTQITLAWLLAQGQDIFPIPGTTNPTRVTENCEAARIVLSVEEEQEIRKACDKAEVAGERYPPSFAAHLFLDTPPLPSSSN